MQSERAQPDTFVEVLDEDQLEEGKVCGCLVQSGIDVAGRSGEGDARSKFESRSIVALCCSYEVGGRVRPRSR